MRLCTAHLGERYLTIVLYNANKLYVAKYKFDIFHVSRLRFDLTNA
jgi:hypothetical protein